MPAADLKRWAANRLALFGAVAVVEFGLIWHGATPLMDAEAAAGLPAPVIPPGLPAKSAAPKPVEARVGAILSRPLFILDRAPPHAASPAPAAAIPPRLTALIIAAGERRAIFAGPDGQRPFVVGEGGKVGPFTVTSIRPGEIELAGPAGVHRLHLAADAGLRSQFAYQIPIASPIDPARREAETETDQ